MNEETIMFKLESICDALKEQKRSQDSFQAEMRNELSLLRECNHCTNAPSFREKFKTLSLMITTLGALTGAFFLLFLAHATQK